jgi:hypothetical protein
MCPECGFPIDEGNESQPVCPRVVAPTRQNITIPLPMRHQVFPVCGSSSSSGRFGHIQ